jgi:hypothetical protein
LLGGASVQGFAIGVSSICALSFVFARGGFIEEFSKVEFENFLNRQFGCSVAASNWTL